MPEISITADQERRLAEVQARIGEELVGKYGHVRAQDAVEYLLDQHEAGLDDDAELSAPAVASETAAATAAAATVDTEADADTTSETDDDTDGDDTDADGDDTDGASDGVGDDAVDDSTPPTPGGGGSAMLDSMMNLLDTHDDKWGESASSEERYQVELPDGTTETARTKDDVRALLFKHYR